MKWMVMVAVLGCARLAYANDAQESKCVADAKREIESAVNFSDPRPVIAYAKEKEAKCLAELKRTAEIEASNAQAAAALEAQRKRRSPDADEDPVAFRIAKSAHICQASAERSATMKTLAKERRLAKQAGVVDLELLREYQNTLRDDDNEIASTRSELAEHKMRPLPCRDPAVATFMSEVFGQ